MCTCASLETGRMQETSRHGARHGARHGVLCLAVAVVALACVSAARAAHDKRAEMSPVPFVMGSRYGRSPERVMTPRNDRFFMGSRYGKRAESVDDPASAAVRAVATGATCGRGARGPCAALLCEYTGVLSLFTCVRPHKHLLYAKRGDEVAGPGGTQED